MKKWLTLCVMGLSLLVLTACNNNSTTETTNDDGLTIYTTVYPLEYFAKQIGGEYVNVNSIYPPGSNEHTFEPTQKDMINLADSDLFFYIGLGLEGFVEKAEQSLEGEHVKFVPTAADVPEKDLDISTGHVHGEEDHEEDHEDEHDDHDESEHDAHVWLSPVISQQLATVIKDELVKAMPEQEQVFTENYNELIQNLQQLDAEYEEMGAHVTSKTFFVSHAAFGYIAGHYGLTQVPIAGLNSQSEPSQKELAAIVDTARKENAQYIFYEQNVSSNLSKVIEEEVGAQSLTLHNLSVLTASDIKNNENYFTLMRKNLESLEKALSN